MSAHPFYAPEPTTYHQTPGRPRVAPLPVGPSGEYAHATRALRERLVAGHGEMPR
jgi:hypothetical protein